MREKHLRHSPHNYMTREIKFRAWEKRENSMVDCFDVASSAFLLNDNYELMQYTGLKDKNGKEIYEGDILQVTNNSENVIWEVYFNQKGGAFMIKNKLGDDVVMWPLTNLEIIGNIHENPELLKNKYY